MKKFFVAVFALLVTCLTTFGTVIAQWDRSFCAEDETPFFVSAKDFEVDSFVLTEENFLLTLKYIGEHSSGLPQVGTSPYDISNLKITTENNDVLALDKLSPVNNDAYSVTFQFPLQSVNGALGFEDATPTKLVITMGSVIGVSTEYMHTVGVYTSLSFTSTLTIEKYTEENDTEYWRCVETQTYERFEADINDTDTFHGLERDENDLLYALITIPYTATDNAVYNGVVASFNGMNYNEKPIITQEKGTKILRISFPDSAMLAGNMGNATLTLHGGELIEKELGIQLVISGERTFYGYADGVFSEEKRIEIRISDGKYYDVTTVPVTTNSYLLPNAKGSEGKIFYAWNVCGEIYQDENQVDLTPFITSGLDVLAEYIDCRLVDGGWINVDKEVGKIDIRFQTIIPQSVMQKYREYICGMGVIIMPSDLLEEEKEFTIENYAHQPQARNFYTTRRNLREVNDVYSIHGDICDIEIADANRQYTARGYLLMNFDGKDVYYWCESVVERSPYQLAVATLNDKAASVSEEEKTILQSYVHSVLNITFDGENATVENPIKEPTASLIAHEKRGNTVTLVLRTTVRNFACVSYNGKRIEENKQIFNDGILTIEFTV